ncbi:V-type ATP synthase subunit D [Thiolapillus sp.]|uniref:V-type ATP synthase subunit D n=1 Tax=Thiolapillus sp. TaxID=2017437 RepID=UPI003AF47B93
MTQRLPIPPTRNALLQLENQLEFLTTGHDLLERKRELLTRMVREQLGTYRKLREEAAQLVDSAYYWLSITHMRMGERMLHLAGLGLEPSVEVKILPRSNLGVEYPAVRAGKRPLQPVSLMWTDASFDRMRICLTDMAVVLAQLGEAEIALRRMLNEQRKTQKRVNALKYNIIPRYEASIHFIQETLEEEERDSLFQVKLLQEQDHVI